MLTSVEIIHPGSRPSAPLLPNYREDSSARWNSKRSKQLPRVESAGLAHSALES